eukprot:3176583-Rhodomonas_salina.1
MEAVFNFVLREAAGAEVAGEVLGTAGLEICTTEQLEWLNSKDRFYPGRNSYSTRQVHLFLQY